MTHSFLKKFLGWWLSLYMRCAILRGFTSDSAQFDPFFTRSFFFLEVLLFVSMFVLGTTSTPEGDKAKTLSSLMGWALHYQGRTPRPSTQRVGRNAGEWKTCCRSISRNELQMPCSVNSLEACPSASAAVAAWKLSHAADLHPKWVCSLALLCTGCTCTKNTIAWSGSLSATLSKRTVRKQQQEKWGKERPHHR